jgi:hypothetical protein
MTHNNQLSNKMLLRYDVGVYDAKRQIRSEAALKIEATE